ncbi:hypothetical protein GGF46_003354 [Coemansia sp. RSA 552]|nr:hypothetical protein GGF46_003354 [Coemansia sp. RSA 552]
MKLLRYLLPVTLTLAIPLTAAAGTPEPPAGNTELTQAEARTIAARLSSQFVDRLYELRTATEHLGQARAKDDDLGDNDDPDDSTNKLINKAAKALRPIIKELATVVNTALPAGPSRQLVKTSTDAVDNLLPLILKYAIGA